MTNENDWRAERAAQLAGTPFARPSPPARDRIDDTLPIGRNEPKVSLQPPVARPAPRPAPSTASGGQSAARMAAGKTRWWLPIAAALAVIVAARVWLANGRETQRSPVIASTAPAPVETVVPPSAPSPTAPPPAAAIGPAAPAASDPTIVPIAAPHVKARAAAIAAATPTTPPTVHRKTSGVAARVAAHPKSSHPAAAPVLPVVTITVPACMPGTSRMICANPTLAALDREMRQLSAGVVADGDPRLIAKAERGDASFLKKRDHCRDETCLGKAYTHRIAALQKLHKKAVVAEERAREKTLPICDKGVTPSSTTCRPAHRRFSLKRLFGG